MKIRRKIQRWNVGQWNYHGAPNKYGDWCKYCDVSRLEESHAELLEVVKLALKAHNVGLPTYPPQDAWVAYGVERKMLAAIKNAEEIGSQTDGKSEEVNQNINYANYLAENADRALKYSDYLVENLNNAIGYSEALDDIHKTTNTEETSQ